LSVNLNNLFSFISPSYFKDRIGHLNGVVILCVLGTRTNQPSGNAETASLGAAFREEPGAALEEESYAAFVEVSNVAPLGSSPSMTKSILNSGGYQRVSVKGGSFII